MVIIHSVIPGFGNFRSDCFYAGRDPLGRLPPLKAGESEAECARQVEVLTVGAPG